jgi:hypothetical protein
MPRPVPRRRGRSTRAQVLAQRNHAARVRVPGRARRVQALASEPGARSTRGLEPGVPAGRASSEAHSRPDARLTDARFRLSLDDRSKTLAQERELA